MLILPKRKSTFNFFESFSDLVFCTLVMFLVLVLFLAMNVNQKQEQVAIDQQKVIETRAEIEKEELQLETVLADQRRLRDTAQAEFDAELAKIEEQRKTVIAEAERQMAAERQRIQTEIDARRAALSTMEREVERQRRMYEQALGANRFTGLPARPRLVVAYDWQPTRIAVHPVPAWFVDEINTTPPGLTDAQLAEYFSKLRARFVELAKDAEPLNPRQYRALIRAVSVGLEPVPRVGDDRRVSLDLEFIVNDDGLPTTQVGVAIPGGNGANAGIRAGDTLIAVGEQSVTVDNLPGLLSRFVPGDTVRLLVRRAGKPVAVELTFREVRVVELVEAYRTDLSMVISGALDADYTYLWEPVRADNLRARLQQGQAAEAVWQGGSRWDARTSTQGRPVLRFDVVPNSDEIEIADQRFTLKQFRRVLEALGGGGIVVEYDPRLGPKELPQKIYEQALRPTGFVIRAPQLDKLLEKAGE